MHLIPKRKKDNLEIKARTIPRALATNRVLNCPGTLSLIHKNEASQFRDLETSFLL